MTCSQTAFCATVPLQLCLGGSGGYEFHFLLHVVLLKLVYAVAAWLRYRHNATAVIIACTLQSRSTW